MHRRAVLSLFALSLLVCFAGTARAQGTHQFLGEARPDADKITPRFGIRFNAQGFDNPSFNWEKKIKKWQKKAVPGTVIEEMLTFPGAPDAIPTWIDQAYDKVRSQFAECGGTLSQRASRVVSKNLKVTIMPSAFYEPYWKINVAGAYYPKSREIKVLNIYYIWSGPNKGWLRHAKDLLEWEIGNFMAVESGVQPEPRPKGWPCNAPVLK
jgi:hypothetical protein